VSSVASYEAASPFATDGWAVKPVDSAVSVDVADAMAVVKHIYKHNKLSPFCDVIDPAGAYSVGSRELTIP